MIQFDKKIHNFLWLVVSIVVAFSIGYIHHRWFYPLQFNGDSAAMQVLAKAILDEGSLLPSDFSYGNQLIFLRSSPFIALASILGCTAYDAFAVGSSLSLAFWGGILYLFLNALFRSERQAFLFSTLLLVPFGFWDSEFVLGQQSHLANAILSIGIVVSVLRFIKDRRYSFIFIGSVCLFLSSLESPIRGLLVVVPVVVATAIVVPRLKEFFVVTIPMGLMFLSAYCLNKILITLRPIALNHLEVLAFRSSGEILSNLVETTGETVASVSSLDIWSGVGISLFGGILFSFGLLVIISYLVLVLIGVGDTTKMISSRLKGSQGGILNASQSDFSFVRLVVIVGLIFGALAVAALNPDSSRHYLWAIFLGKLVILKWLYDTGVRCVGVKFSSSLLLVLALLVSVWCSTLVKLQWNTEGAIKARNYTTAVNDIQELSKSLGISNIYGEDFWRMMPLNTLIDGLNSQSLLSDGYNVYPWSWLTRPSWACVDDTVLYYLQDGTVDQIIRGKLISLGGSEVKSGNGYSIWVGPRVWRFTSDLGCYESSLVYEEGSLAALPSTAGILKEGTRVTEGKAGFLVYGPYSPLKQGSYELTVLGSSDLMSDAYVDVASGLGEVVHARFNLKKLDEGFLLKNAVVKIPENVSDIEVRVWVGEQDKLVLSGYTLKLQVK